MTPPTPDPGHRLPVPRRAIALLLTAAALALATAPPPAAGDALTCSRDSVLTPSGLDTQSGRALFSLLGAGAEGGWWIELAGDGARSYPHPAGERVFGGSVGPGEPFAVRDCGSACLQAVRWRAGSWEPFGEPLRAPVVSTVHATYDLAGTPWLVLESPAEDPAGGPDPALRKTRAWAFRYEGREWVSRGALAVTATGALGAVPDAVRRDAVLSGSGRFSATAEPVTWLEGLPRLPPERQGEAVPADGAVIYLDADGQPFLSRDAGASWERSSWTPWGAQRASLWQAGQDFTVDLPIGDRRGPLAMAWLDRRRGAAGSGGAGEGERLLLTTWSPGAGWRLLAELAAEVVTLDGARLPFDHFLIIRPGEWLMLAGCAFTRAGPGLVLRTYGRDGLSAPRFVEIRPGG